MIEVGDPLQVPCYLKPGAYKEFNVGAGPSCRVMFPDWKIQSTFDARASGKPESDKCVRILDPEPRVHLEVQNFVHLFGG